MKRATSQAIRVLAVDPVSRGFGYAILEGPRQLVDWGVRDARTTKNTGCVKRVEELIEWYEPDVLVLEDSADTRCRRRGRVRDLIERVRKLALRKHLRCRSLPWCTVRKALGNASTTKQEIATILANRFPELALRLPPPRKSWMSEDARLGIFDALALGVVFFETKNAQVAIPQQPDPAPCRP